MTDLELWQAAWTGSVEATAGHTMIADDDIVQNLKDKEDR